MKRIPPPFPAGGFCIYCTKKHGKFVRYAELLLFAGNGIIIIKNTVCIRLKRRRVILEGDVDCTVRTKPKKGGVQQ